MASKTVDGLARMCPTCGEPLTIVRKVPPAVHDAGPSRVAVPLASWIYRVATVTVSLESTSKATFRSTQSEGPSI